MKNPGIHKFLIGMINLHAHLAFRRYRNTENWLDDLKLVFTGYSFKISVTFLTAQLEVFTNYSILLTIPVFCIAKEGIIGIFKQMKDNVTAK